MDRYNAGLYYRLTKDLNPAQIKAGISFATGQRSVADFQGLKDYVTFLHVVEYNFQRLGLATQLSYVLPVGGKNSLVFTTEFAGGKEYLSRINYYRPDIPWQAYSKSNGTFVEYNNYHNQLEGKSATYLTFKPGISLRRKIGNNSVDLSFAYETDLLKMTTFRYGVNLNRLQCGETYVSNLVFDDSFSPRWHSFQIGLGFNF